MSQKSLAEMISEARGVCLSVSPYFARGLFRLRFEEDAGIPTMAVTARWRVKYNPEFVQGIYNADPATLAGVVMHELMHGIGLHHQRMGNRLAKFTNGLLVWNAATDVIINEGLPLPLPPGALYRSTFDVPERCSTPEDVYDWLIANAPDGGDADFGGDDLSDEDGERGEGDEELVAKQVAADVKDFDKKNPGRISADVVAWADAILMPPKVRWQDVLRASAQRVVNAWVRGREESTYTRRSRRNGSGGDFILPGRHSPRPRIILIADTSGSMLDNGTGATVLGEVQGLLKFAGGELEVLSIDTAVTFDGRVRSVADMRAAARGGGGTELLPAFERARERRAALIVCITDGYVCTPIPDSAAWVIVPGGSGQSWMRGRVIAL